MGIDLAMKPDREPPGAQDLLCYLKLIAAAEAPAEVLSAVQGYLTAWSKERAEDPQRVDGDWASFDQD